MKETVEFSISGLPIPWKAPYVGARGAYSPRTRIMNDLKLIVREAYRGPFFTSAIHCSFKFYMPIPKATSLKKRKLMIEGSIRPAKTPDRTNICKFYEDVLQGICYANDSQIVGGFVEKWYGENAYTLVQIESVETIQ